MNTAIAQPSQPHSAVRKLNAAVADDPKNAGAVPEELVQSLNKPRKSIKERLLDKLLWGIICIIAGVGAVVLTVVHYCTVGSMDDNGVMLGIGIALLAVGVALLIYYFAGRKVLRSEIEAEERKKTV